MHCAYLTDLHKLRPSENFMICDAGGGTVVRDPPFRPVARQLALITYLFASFDCRRGQDLAVYKVIGLLSSLEIAEMCARSGANCGSLFLDLRFRGLVQTLLADHPAHLDGECLSLPPPLLRHNVAGGGIN